MVNKESFPLWKNDGKFSLRHPSKKQKKGIQQLKKEIEGKNLLLKQNSCLCNNEHPEKDICISEKDRYGLPFPQILCSKCGIIRSGLVFDESSNAKFYKNYYRSIYNAGIPMDEFWKNQCNRGHILLNLLKKHVNINEIQSVADVGCGAGGLLQPFKEIGKLTDGFDFDTDYLAYGKAKGLNLYFGDFHIEAKQNYDLVILSHVLEHFLNPIESIKNVVKRINSNKYLLVEVPGILSIAETYYNPIIYFQNAHIYNFYRDYLRVFFEKMGLKVIYGDENCDFILQKPDNWEYSPSIIYDDSLSEYPNKIEKYISDTQYEWTHRMFNRRLLHHELWLLANKFGWQRIRPYIIKEKK